MGEVERTEDGVLTKFLTVFGPRPRASECMGCILSVLRGDERGRGQGSRRSAQRGMEESREHGSYKNVSERRTLSRPAGVYAEE